MCPFVWEYARGIRRAASLGTQESPGNLGVSVLTEQCKTGVGNVSAHLNHLQCVLTLAPSQPPTEKAQGPFKPAAGRHRGHRSQLGITLSTVLAVVCLKETDPRQMPDLGLGPPKLSELPV